MWDLGNMKPSESDVPKVEFLRVVPGKRAIPLFGSLGFAGFRE